VIQRRLRLIGNGLFFDNSLNIEGLRIKGQMENGYEEGCTRGAKNFQARTKPGFFNFVGFRCGMYIFAIKTVSYVVERLYDTRSRYLELQTGRVEQRVARAFLRIMKQAGRKTDEGILIEFRLSRLHQHHPVHRKPHPIIHLCISYFALAQRHKPLYGID